MMVYKVSNVCVDDLKKVCIYCNQEHALNKFSLEHVFPDALGGSFFPMLFKTRDVCARCNSISGLFVDGAFIKNFFTQNDRSESALNFIDLNEPQALPLKYMGFLSNFAVAEDKVCELWMGCHGGIIYHVRNNADSKYDTIAGGNPIDNKKFSGEVYIFAQSKEEYWNVVLLRSVAAHFKGARYISGNIGLAAGSSYFDSPSVEEQECLNQLILLQGQEHHGSITIQLGFEQRFLCKFALALGANLLGEDFLVTEHAKNLRNAFWDKSVDRGVRNSIDFSNYFSVIPEELSNILAWDGVHTILVYPKDELLLAFIFLFGRKMLVITISNDHELWSRRIKSAEAYVVCQSLAISCGPLLLEDYIGYRIGEVSNEMLDKIEVMRFDLSLLPKITEC